MASSLLSRWFGDPLAGWRPDGLAVYVLASTAVKLSIWWRRGSSAPAGVRRVGRVASIKLYPVKSLGGFELTDAECTQNGLRVPGSDVRDRCWMLITSKEGRFVTARQHPTLLLVQVSLRDGQLCFDAPGLDQLRLPTKPNVDQSVERLETKVWGEPICGWDCGEEAARWFSSYLKEEHRLLYNPGVDLRTIERKPHLYVNIAKDADKLTYHDDGPFLVIQTSSLDDLNRRLVEGNSTTQQVGLETFRPTITVTGDGIPYGEDNWNEAYIGNVKFTQLMPCARCMLTTIDPDSGEIRKDGEPLKTLKTYRVTQSNNNDSPCFGTYFVCDRPGMIRVGDDVSVFP